MLLTPAWLLSAELARSSQEHLQRTVKYGGRRQLPSPSEMKAFLVLGVQAAGHSGTPFGWGELGPLSTGGLTLYLPWQKGQVVHLLLIHLPGGVDYKTNSHTFTVSSGPQRRGWGETGKSHGHQFWGPPPVFFLPQPPITALSLCPGGGRSAGGAVREDGHQGPPGSAGICPLPHQRGR